MKLFTKDLLSRYASYILPIFAFSFLLTSCARKMTFGISSIEPAAHGNIKVTKDKNKNYAMKIKVTNLAPAGRLTPAKKVYVVWLVTENNDTQNLGQLRSSHRLLSKALKASFSAISPTRPVNIFITAEDDPTVHFPGSPVVLKTE